MEQVKTCRRIGFTSDLMVVPGQAPEVSSDDVSQQLEISDVEVLEVGGRAAGDILVGGEVEYADAGETVVPSVGAGVLRDVDGGDEVQEGDTVSEARAWRIH